jgi:Protein of unknown function (DUF2281)
MFFMGEHLLDEIKKLPFEQQKEVEDFVGYLTAKYSQSKPEDIGEHRRKNLGWAKGMIWMADDFNETPEDFKDYM